MLIILLMTVVLIISLKMTFSMIDSRNPIKEDLFKISSLMFVSLFMFLLL